jgi:hypothetical protein
MPEKKAELFIFICFAILLSVSRIAIIEEPKTKIGDNSGRISFNRFLHILIQTWSWDFRIR